MIVEAYMAAPTIYLEIDLDDDLILAELEDPDNAAMGLEDILEKLADNAIAEAKEDLSGVRNVTEIHFHESQIHSHLGDLVELFEDQHPEVKGRHL